VRKTFVTILLLFCTATALAQENSHPRRSAAANAPAFQAHVLTHAELDKLLAHPGDLLIIDVRRPDEISRIGGLPVYLNVQPGDLHKSLEWIPKGRTIVTVSNHAKRAGSAADFLASKGFKVAGAAGVQTYEEEGGKLTKVIPPPANAGAAAGTAGKSNP
jgi:rhodanese-related sulfurtransferase